MKILYINSVYKFGSTGQMIFDLSKLVSDKGYEYKVAYGRKRINLKKDTIKISNNTDKYIHVIKSRLFDNHAFASKKSTELFIEEIKKYDPDIVHLHNIHGYYMNIEILFDYLEQYNKKVIWTLHDCWSFTGHCAYFDYVGCDKWKSGCSKCPQKKQYPKSLLKDNSKENYKRKKNIFTSLKKENLTIVTPSFWLADLVSKSYLKKYNIKVINNGIDLEVFKPLKSDFKEKYNIVGKKVILGVSSYWEKRKGLKYFIQLAKILPQEYKIVLVGINNYQKIILPQNIIIIKRTENREELAKIYSAADIFLNPTLEDNFPTVNLEALACGTSVITFNTGGSGESIDASCGVVLKNKNMDDLVNSIKILSNNDYSQGCIIKSNNYNKSKKYEEYINLYKSLF